MPFPFQIFQSHSAFFIAYEYAGAVRNVYLKDPGEAPVDTWMGQSVGRWEGETFVVDGDRVQRPGLVRSCGQLRQREAEGHRALHADRAGSPACTKRRIEDPDTFTKPWKISFPLYRRVERDAQLMEFKCVEFVEELMYGQWRKTPLPR